MLKNFYTVDKEIEEEIYVKKSQFIASIFPITSEDDFNKKLSIIKKKYKDAKHYVFSYRLSNGIERYSDDGEPAGTAGVPILDVLRGKNICNVLVIVTRYFGGILLGTGGLVKAYSDVVKMAIEKIELKEKFLATEYSIVIPYNKYSTVQKYCYKNDFFITESSFSEIIVLNILIREEKEEKFIKELSEILDGKVKFVNVKRNIYV